MSVTTSNTDVLMLKVQSELLLNLTHSSIHELKMKSWEEHKSLDYIRYWIIFSQAYRFAFSVGHFQHAFQTILRCWLKWNKRACSQFRRTIKVTLHIKITNLHIPEWKDKDCWRQKITDDVTTAFALRILIGRALVFELAFILQFHKSLSTLFTSCITSKIYFLSTWIITISNLLQEGRTGCKARPQIRPTTVFCWVTGAYIIHWPMSLLQTKQKKQCNERTQTVSFQLTSADVINYHVLSLWSIILSEVIKKFFLKNASSVCLSLSFKTSRVCINPE